MAAKIEIDGKNHHVSDEVAELLFLVSKERDELKDLTRCDNCKSQEGRHYCLLKGEPIKNSCEDWEPKEG